MIRSRNLLLGRRVSGGGAVYHDPGNLNVSWVFDRQRYDPDLPGRVLSSALARFGVTTEPGTNGGARVRGKKISGAAFCYRHDRVLHHGTLLVEANLADLRAALSPPRVRVDTHAVASVPAQVANLGDLCPGISVEALARELEAAARKTFGTVVPLDIGEMEGAALRTETERMSSAEWIWGQTPAFTGRVVFRGQALCFSVRHGRVNAVAGAGMEAETKPDAGFGPEFIRWLANRLETPSEQMQQAFSDAGWHFP